MKAQDEKDFAHVGEKTCRFRAEDIENSAEFRRFYEQAADIVRVADQPFERSPDGLIKHLVNHRMKTRECCVEAYMQFLPPEGRSGKHRHMWEEIVFVLEGEGHDLHWDLKFDCIDKYEWDWETEPKRFEWQRGDFIYVPPFSIHQHFSRKKDGETRLLVISNRIVKTMGFDWLDQLEHAPGF